MIPAEAAARLEAVLRAENAALERHDAAGSAALLEEKLAAARGLPAKGVPPEAALRLRELVGENKRLLERAIRVQDRIMAMVARAARQSPPVAHYGASGGAVPDRGGGALAKQA